MDVQAKDEGFAVPQAPFGQRKDHQGDDTHMETRNCDDMGHSGNNEFLPDLLRNLLPLAQDQGLQNATGFGGNAPIEEASDPVPPRLHELKEGVPLPPGDDGNSPVVFQVSRDPDPLACQKSAVVKCPGVIEISRVEEFRYETDPVSMPEISPIFLNAHEDIAPSPDNFIGEVNLLDP